MGHTLGRVGRWVWVGVVGALVLSGVAWGAAAYLQPSDWQYRALDSLAQQGLLAGHPKAPLSSWTDRLSRYEAASLTLRAVEGIGQVYQAQGAKLRELAQVNEPEQTPETGGPEGPALRTQDLVTTQKLLEEFHTELAGMGEKLDELQASLKLVLGVVDELKKQVADVASEQKKHKIDGYTQFRYVHDEAAQAAAQDFLVRRVRVNLRGPVAPQVSYRVEAQFDSKESGKGPGSKAQLRTLALDYKFNDRTFLRGGQVILPWGYELEESVPNLWTGERSLWMDRLFPDQRDIGFFVEHRASPTAPQFDFGLFNGNSINANENNAQVNALGRVNFTIAPGSVALSAYKGTSGEGTSRTDQNRYGLSSRLGWGDVKFLGEWVTGQDKGADVRGWYAQLGGSLLKNRPNLLFAKYDMFDEDTDASNDTFKRWSLGYWCETSPANRFTFVWELRDPESGFSEFTKWNGDAQYFQWQVKF